MPTVTSIVINDGAATPVARTFTPIGKDDKGVTWYEQTSPTPVNGLAAIRLGYRQTRPVYRKGVLSESGKVIWTIAYPALETLGTADSGITPPATLAYRIASRHEFDLPERSLRGERKHLRVLGLNLLNVPDVAETIDGLIPIFGG